MAKLIINCDVAKSDADLSAIPAFIDDAGNVIYWDNLSKDIAQEIWMYGMGINQTYTPDKVGSVAASEILGCLEDQYPEWVEEFETYYFDACYNS